MEEITEKIIEINFNQLNNLKLEFNKKIGLIVHLNGVKYEFILNLKDGDKLIILGSGAIGFSDFDRSRPYFERHSWNFEYSAIYYNDPTYYIDDSITAGWGIGTEDEYYLENISKILQIIISKLNVDNRNVLLYGSSAGGFTSLLLSIFIKNSMALVDVPQFYIYNYKSKDKALDVWLDVKNNSFDMSIEEFIMKYKPRLNFIEMMKIKNYVPNAYLRLDCSVNLDFYTQYIQFFMDLFQSSFSSDGNRIKLLIDWRNRGHVPLNKEDTIDLIDSVFLINDKKNGKISINTNLSGNNPQFDKTISDKLKKYNTSRIDFKFEGDNTSLKILNIDGFPEINEPSWLNNESGAGLIVMNENNSMNIKLKCAGEGNLIIKLRSMDIKNNNGKRIPIYLNYNKFLINDDELIFNEDIIVWHDDPFTYERKINGDEIINIFISYAPY